MTPAGAALALVLALVLALTAATRAARGPKLFQRWSDWQLVPECGDVVLPQDVCYPLSQLFPRRRRRRRSLEINGQTAELEQGRWPWMALLGERVNGQRRWTCGGTLISARTVLTAAHCVDGRQPADLKVRLGEYDLSTTRDGKHVNVPVARIVVHPRYRRKHNDLALLHLGRPVPISRQIKPACLPPGHADHTGRPVDLAGWGHTEFQGKVSRVLHEARLRVVNVSRCEQAYEHLLTFDRDFPGGFQGTKLCANSADGTSKDACQGDSGGPLVYRTTGIERRYQVIGVVSTGLGCGNPNYPGIYTKVSMYVLWILRNSI
ncbi:Clotting factor B [Amphibalanus amphitrite]|uniref:limulus clotting factor C n=1 Tax=Amphibalanus amphitrite TaxID=1232801 RepID=A0A6A4V2Q8_AMPAM|nr:Clotting factor B [Amphibalanus amphitrite]